jgi:hypothetical protein
MSDLYPVTLEDMIAEARRELEMRRTVYARMRNGSGVARRAIFDRQFDVMAAILRHLEAERAHGRGTVAGE